MSTYEFRKPDGEIVSRYFAASAIPELGATVTIDGVDCVRILSCPQIDAGVRQKVHGFPYVSYSMPRQLSGAEHDSAGRPVITSQRHEREMCRRHNRVVDRAFA